MEAWDAHLVFLGASPAAAPSDSHLHLPSDFTVHSSAPQEAPAWALAPTDAPALGTPPFCLTSPRVKSQQLTPRLCQPFSWASQPFSQAGKESIFNSSVLKAFRGFIFFFSLDSAEYRHHPTVTTGSLFCVMMPFWF